MAEAPPLVGLPGNLALWRLLALKGQPMNLRALEEALAEDFSDESLVRELSARGFEARLVDLQIQDLGNLELPTLAQLHNGNWLLLRQRVPGGCLLEQGLDGPDKVSLERLALALAGPALDLSQPLVATGGLWTRLARLLPRQRGTLGQVLALTLAAQGLGLVAPWLTGQVVDQSLSRGAFSLLDILCAGLVLAALFQAWMGWLKEATLLAFTTRLDATLEKGLFEHLLNLPYSYLQGRTLGELLQTFSGLRRARSLVLDRGLGALYSGVSALAFLVYMAMVMPGPTVLVVLVAVAASLLAMGAGYFQGREQAREVEAAQEENSALVELLTGAATLKATACQTWALGRWGGRLRRQLGHALRRERLGLGSEVGFEALNQGLLATLLVWGGRKVLQGDLTLGGLLVFVQLSSGFTAALLALANTVVAFISQRPQLRAVRACFDQERTPKPPRRGSGRVSGPVLVEDVWFRYGPKAPWILQGTSLEVPLGSFHAIHGPSGSGKSTLLRLLAGLYPPASGRISIGGLESAAAAPFMAFLPQFPQLYGGSILENLRLFSGQTDHHHLMAVAKDTGLDAWVTTLPMGYQTLVASGGENFSGGQRQLVALTAILASRQQILLLDEAMSNLDWVSRSQIMHCTHFQGRTVIYASHEELLRPAPPGE